MYLEISTRYASDLKEVPVVGDSLRDLLSAIEVGAKPVLVKSGKGVKTLTAGGFPPKARWTARGCAANARKLERILSNLLDLERLIRGVVEPTLKPVDVGSLVRQIVEEADFLGKRQVHVQAGTVVADVDAVKIERIVENLLVNAARHTPEGTPIWVRVCPEQGGVLLQWKMQGSGCRRMPGRESSSLSNRAPRQSFTGLRNRAVACCPLRGVASGTSMGRIPPGGRCVLPRVHSEPWSRELMCSPPGWILAHAARLRGSLYPR